eukprot:scaffold305762_cov15-Prasinocladus_malaysianus.AAC.1
MKPSDRSLADAALFRPQQGALGVYEHDDNDCACCWQCVVGVIVFIKMKSSSASGILLRTFHSADRSACLLPNITAGPIIFWREFPRLVRQLPAKFLYRATRAVTKELRYDIVR